jgi:hypothetical protein
MILIQPLRSQFSCDTIPSCKFHYFISIVSLPLSYLSGGNKTSILARSLTELSYLTIHGEKVRIHYLRALLHNFQLKIKLPDYTLNWYPQGGGVRRFWLNATDI